MNPRLRVKQRKIKMKLMGKKGFALNELSGVALVFVLLGVTLAIGAYILSSVNTAGGFTAGSASATAIGNATNGVSQLATWLPIIAIVIAAGVVIAVLVNAFSNRGV